MHSSSMTRRGLVSTAAAGALLAGSVRPGWAAPPRDFVFGNPSEYDTLDPHVVSDLSRAAPRINCYDNLYRWSDNPPKLAPWLAESSTVSPDGLSYRFVLRKGVKFHDGTELTAEDVVYSMDRMLALKRGAAGLFSPVVQPGSTKAIDTHTVEFNLVRRAAIFMSIVPEISIVNAKLVKSHVVDNDWGAAWLARNEAGSGSYMLDRYDPAVAVQLKRNPEHFRGWQANKKPVERIQLRVVRETTSLLLGLKRGDLDDIDLAPSADQLKDLKGAAGVQIVEQPSLRLFVLHINNQKPPFNDVHVRRAISYAFDYGAFIDDILAGTVERNPAPVPKPLWGYPKDLVGYEYSIEKAKAELTKASVKIDRPIEIHTLVGADQSDQAATLMQAGLRQLGIEARIVAETWPTLSGKAAKADTTPDIWTNWVSATYADPHNWVGEMYSSKNWGTWKTGSWYKNDKVDALLDAAYSETDQAKRDALYQDACRIVVDDAASVFIYNTKWFGLFSKRLQGYRFTPIANGEDFRWVSVD